MLAKFIKGFVWERSSCYGEVLDLWKQPARQLVRGATRLPACMEAMEGNKEQSLKYAWVLQRPGFLMGTLMSAAEWQGLACSPGEGAAPQTPVGLEEAVARLTEGLE